MSAQTAPVPTSLDAHSRRSPTISLPRTLSSGQVLQVACVVFGITVTLMLLVRSDGVPYVTDGNESFSTYNHGLNLLRFGAATTMGLTDEASSPGAAAHPYVYTHQGNLPRFASLLLLVLGVHSVVLHVAAISLVVGTAATMLCFRFFSRAVSPPFAALVCLVFWTDYVLFIQWQLNSYRVWHAFFLFGVLVCAQSVGPGRRWPTIGLLVLSAGLFYFEFIFAVFVAVLVAAYSLMKHSRQPRQAVRILSLLVAGGGFAVTALVAQLIAFLGPALMFQDVQATYFARNFATGIDAKAAREEVLRFFMEHYIVFWDAFDATPYLSAFVFVRTLASTLLVVYTPVLVTITTAVLGGLAFGVIAVGNPPRILPLHVFRLWKPPARAARLALLLADNRLGGHRLPWLRVLGVFVPSVVVIAWTAGERSLYPIRSVALWRDYLEGGVPPFVLQIALFGGWALGALLATRGTTAARELAASADVKAVSRYLLAGLIAFLTIYCLSPGYLYGGYLSRYVPLPVFVTDVMFALVLYVLLRLVHPLLTVIRPGRAPQVRESLVGVVALSLLGFMGTYWAFVQLTYLTYLPPDGAAFLNRLEAPSFETARVVSNNYALPIAVLTGGWAFQDETLGLARWFDSTLRDIEISGKYMWFRDRDTNPGYLRPRYYICRTDRNLDTVADLVNTRTTDRLPRCSAQPLVQQALSGQMQLIARDQSRADLWAIVGLGPSIRLHPTWRNPVGVGAVTRRGGYGFRSGFYESESTDALVPSWTDGRGVLELFPAVVGETTLSFTMVQPDFGSPRPLPDLTVSADGQAIPNHSWSVEQLSPGHYRVRIPLTVGPTQGIPIVLTLDSPTFVPSQHDASSTDERQLGVRVEEIRMEEGQ